MKKSALILLVAVAISTVSCVDNAESPLVGALRSQQVEWMKAKTAQQVAETAFTTAETAYKVASEALLLKRNEADYAASVARNADLLIIAQYTMAKAKADFDAALVETANAMELAGDAKGIAYLAKYTDAASNLAGKIGNRLLKQNELINAELIVAAHPEELAAYLVDTQSNIDAEEAKIVGYNASIALYNNIDGRNSDSYKAELETLLIKTRALEVTKIKLLYDIVRNDLELGLLVAPFDTKTEARFDENESRKAKLARIDAIDGSANVAGANDKEIATLKAEILVLNASIAKLDAELKVIVASKKTLDDSNTSKNDLIDANAETMLTDSSVINALYAVIYQLSANSLTVPGSLDLATLVSDLKSEITISESLIEFYKSELTNTTTTEAIVKKQERIIELTREIATADVEITAQEKIVAYWKALVDKIFTA